MGGIFRDILQVSLGMSVVIGIMLVIVPIVRKRYDVRWSYLVWLIISMRLLLPFKIQWYEMIKPFQSISIEIKDKSWQ